MSGMKKTLVIAVVSSLGLWGCAKGPAGSASAERIKALEYKVAKLEEDFRAAAAARDGLLRRLAASESQRKDLVAQLGQSAKEREDLRKLVSARTTERDVLQTQYDQFRKGLRDLLGQAEAAAPNLSSQPVTAAVPPSQPGKS